MDALTARQRECLEFCRTFLDKHGFPPTRVEIAKGMGITSTNTATYHLKALERKGYVKLFRNLNRNIRIVKH